MKTRLVYTQVALGKYSSKEHKEIEEAVAEPHWVCRALLFDEQHPLTEQVVREELTCCSPAEALFNKRINKLYAGDEADEQLALCAHCALQAGQVDEEIAAQHHGVLPVCADCKSYRAQARGKRKSGAAARAKRIAVAEARSARGYGAAKHCRSSAADTVPPAIAAAESTDDDEEQQQEWETEDESA
jgi:hypothetical protein